MQNILLYITYLGNWQIIVPLTAIITIYFTLTQQKKQRSILLISTTGNTAIVYALKEIIKAPRPEGAIVTESTYSFPSGHANIAIAFYGIMIYMVWISNMTKIQKTIATMPIAIFVVLIPYSRIYLGVHYPKDVYAGIIIGIVWSITSILIGTRFSSSDE